MKSGKVKHAGVSNHNLDEIKLAASILVEEGLEISAFQNHYSYFSVHRKKPELLITAMKMISCFFHIGIETRCIN